MSRSKSSGNAKTRARRRRKPSPATPKGVTNKAGLKQILQWLVSEKSIFDKSDFHGNIKWEPEQLVSQALLWSWQEAKNVTDAFDHSLEVCQSLGFKKIANSYTSLLNALDRYRDTFSSSIRKRCQELSEEAAGDHFRMGRWVLIGFDGSRTTTPRTVSNEKAFCASNYGNGKRSKYGKKKSKGMRRKRNKANPCQPQAPQVWITMMWHMGLRLPWTWRLGPSNSSERGHVAEMLTEEEFATNTLFCGDAGFVGYPLWSKILLSGYDFVVRVGANVSLLSEHSDIKRQGGGIVLCWPKGRMESGDPPLRLRLVRVTVGKTKMWLLTSVTDQRELSNKALIRVYQLRWGIEVEFRGLKQTLDKHHLRCRKSNRTLAELDWSIRAMAIAELLGFREQASRPRRAGKASPGQASKPYDPIDRSLANVMRALRAAMRNVDKAASNDSDLLKRLSEATVERYQRRSNQRSRYRPKNPDKKALGEPVVAKLSAIQRKRQKEIDKSLAA